MTDAPTFEDPWEYWHAEAMRLRTALSNIVQTEVLTTVDQIKDYARTVIAGDAFPKLPVSSHKRGET